MPLRSTTVVVHPVRPCGSVSTRPVYRPSRASFEQFGAADAAALGLDLQQPLNLLGRPVRLLGLASLRHRRPLR
ncbi:hypothetical protein SALBM311S_10420 [Streptomyces alboniger]